MFSRQHLKNKIFSRRDLKYKIFSEQYLKYKIVSAQVMIIKYNVPTKCHDMVRGVFSGQDPKDKLQCAKKGATALNI